MGFEYMNNLAGVLIAPDVDQVELSYIRSSGDLTPDKTKVVPYTTHPRLGLPTSGSVSSGGSRMMKQAYG